MRPKPKTTSATISNWPAPSPASSPTRPTLALYKTSGGVCRLLNRLCLAALNRGVLQQKATLDEEDIYQASDEL